MTTTYAESMEGTTVPWWFVLLEGIAAVIIRILLLTSPGITLLALVQGRDFEGSTAKRCCAKKAGERQRSGSQ